MSLPNEVNYDNLSYRILSPNELSVFGWDLKERETRDLKQSLENGIVEPLKIRKMPLGSEVWDGEEILRFMKENDIEKAPCISYGELSDEKTKALKFNLARQRGNGIDMKKVHSEWLRLEEEEEWSFREIAECYGVPESRVYKGVSEHESQLEDDQKTEFDQVSLSDFESPSTEQEESSQTGTDDDSGFKEKRKSLKERDDPLIDKKPKEIKIMISGRLNDYLSQEISDESGSIPSKIVEILNSYYRIK